MAELGSLPEMPIAAPRRRSVLGPLHEPLFRTIWIAAVISYTGTWMQNVGAAWLMTSLTMSPLMVGLVQAAGSIAVFLVVLPAGAIADMVDRRKLLLFTQTWMVLAAAGLGVLTLAGKVTPALLLLFTLLMGVGAVLNDPAWQAITPETVSQQNFAAGIALNSAGFNVARAIGPALGGLVIAAAGSGIAFLAERGFVLWRDLFPVPVEAAAGANHAAGHPHDRGHVRRPAPYARLSRGEERAGTQRGLQHFRQRFAGVCCRCWRIPLARKATACCWGSSDWGRCWAQR